MARSPAATRRRWTANGSDPRLAASPLDALARLVLAALGALALATFRDYGISWDEPLHGRYGESVLRFWSSGFADRGATQLAPLQDYGGLFDAGVALLVRASPLPPDETRHLVQAGTGWVGLWGTWRLARQVGGPQAGLWAILLLAAVPSYYGHLFVNPKDLPFAVGYVWALYGLARLGATLPRPPPGALIGLGLALGFACGVRIAGAVLAVDLALLLLLELAWTHRAREGRAPLRARARETALLALLVLSIAYGATIAFWPSALLDPLHRPFEALVQHTRHVWSGRILFRGVAVPAQELPWDYLPGYLGVKLPELFLALFGAALPGLALATWRALRDCRPEPLFARAALWLGLGPPVAFAVAFRTVHFDGIRHFLFLLPPMACIASLAAAGGIRALARRSRAGAALGVALLLAGLVHTARTMVQLHPYQYVYYNALAGGPAGAMDHYELDYWATSHREAVAGLVSHLAKTPPSQRPSTVFVCQAAGTALPYLPPGLTPVESPEEADFYLALRRWNCPDRMEGEVVASVERMGAVLAIVKDVRLRREAGR